MKFSPRKPNHMYLAKFLVVEVCQSVMHEDHVKLTCRGKSGATPKVTILVLPKDELVTPVGGKTGTVNPNTPKAAPIPKPPPTAVQKCHCVNHMGTRKQKYHTREAAVAAILKRHLRYGGHGVYECKTEPGIFHVRSQKMRIDTRST